MIRLSREVCDTTKAHLDVLEGGFLRGWVYDSESPEKEQYFAVEINGQVITQGKTGIFREDLKNAGMGNGRHGFTISIDDNCKKTIDREIKIISSSGKAVKSNKYTISVNEGMFWCGVERIENCHLVGSLVSEKFQGEKQVLIFDEDKQIAAFTMEVSPGHNQFTIPLPLDLFNGDIHQISVGVSNFPFRLWRDVRKLEAVLTPWEYLKGSFKEPGVMGLSSSSQHRYESLRHQIEAIATEQTSQKMSDVHKAHDLVVQGWHGRKSFPKLTLPKFKNPEVSIIIPAYNKLELTYHSIASIILSYNKTSYEVIVADDCSTDDTQRLEEIVEHVRVVHNEENMLFLRSCNNAAKYAKGKYLIFLNNDTEVTSFWIDELIAPYKASSYQQRATGLTGSKLLNLDGSLQEAGGIIWGSGQPWNVGNGSNPIAPEFNYVREADYLSGAALCLPVTVWNEVGGFSEELAPAYYEDTDIAFKVREAGYRTLYTPHSQVVHFEGQSNGRDLTKGIKRYQVVNEGKFRSKWYQAYKNNGQEGVNLHIHKDRNIDRRVLVIDYATPDANADAGSYAAVQEMKLLQSLGFKVTFVPENMAYFGKLTHKLQKMGIEVLYSPFYSSVYDVIEKRISEFDAIYITRYSVAEKYIDDIRHRSQAKIIFNNADLHFLRELRASLTEEYKDLESVLKTRDGELAVMNKVDAILSYNETEHAVIMSHLLKGGNIFKCPWVLEEKTSGKPFAEREGIAFLGGYRHHPNVEAVKFFAKEVMPKLAKEMPDVTFYIYGSHPSKEVEALECDNIVVKGFVENLDDVFHNHRLFVAPLLSGAGIKGKVLEAMAYGTPTVLTEVAAEATGLSHKISALMAEKPEEWVEYIKSGYEDEKLWDRLSENSMTLAKEQFSFIKGQNRFRDMFESIGIYTQ